MRTYDLWIANTDAGSGIDFEIMAIAHSRAAITPKQAQTYFSPKYGPVRHYGLISIDGDDSHCAEYFSVK